MGDQRDPLLCGLQFGDGGEVCPACAADAAAPARVEIDNAQVAAVAADRHLGRLWWLCGTLYGGSPAAQARVTPHHEAERRPLRGRIRRSLGGSAEAAAVRPVAESGEGPVGPARPRDDAGGGLAIGAESCRQGGGRFGRAERDPPP
jgi:hypothetical protein